VRGIVVSHGHEDHVGAIPYLAGELAAPVYASRLTKALIEVKMLEFPDARAITLREYKDDDILQLGLFRVSFVRVNHSIPDAFTIVVETPEGTVVYTGDFKFDLTSPDGVKTDFKKLEALGKKRPLLLMCESTNAEMSGHTPSEKVIKEAFDQIFAQTRGRLIVSSFASRLDRMQYVLDAAVKYGRKVAIAGRSMANYFEVASRLGYLKYPHAILVPLSAINKYPNDKIVILSSGSQGQEGSALFRMAFREHREVKIKAGDTVVLSSSPIPGNERAISAVIDNFLRLGAKVVYNRTTQVHVTGHAYQEELKQMMTMVKPQFLMPVHGEYHMLMANKQLAEEVGIPEEKIVVMDDGQVVEFKSGRLRLLESRVPSGVVMVDGLGVGDVGEIVLRDRQAMSKDGMLVVIATVDKKTGSLITSPDIISRGFVYMREQEDLINRTRDRIKKILSHAEDALPDDWSNIKFKIREEIGQFLYDETRRRPLILPVVIEV
jgi:ribonuclease J